MVLFHHFNATYLLLVWLLPVGFQIFTILAEHLMTFNRYRFMLECSQKHRDMMRLLGVARENKKKRTTIK